MTSAEFEKSQSALRTLEALGFDVKEQWRELTLRQEAQDRGTPTADDARYELPLVAPSTESHLKGGNEVLDPSRLWNGMSYTLSPGMRGILRDLYELTPTQTVTVAWVEPWPGTRHPYRMCLRSDEHVDPRRRKHVLTQVVVNEVGKFFRMSAERDAADVDSKSNTELVETALTVGRIINLCNEDRWAIADICGVKVLKQVEVLRVNAESVTFLCLKSGNKATLPRAELLATVAEYVKLYKVSNPRTRSVAFDATPALDALIAGL
jgi:hypothetical protein